MTSKAASKTGRAAAPSGIRSCSHAGTGGLRGEVLAAIADELDRVGPERFRPATVIRRFKERIGRPTLTRWINEATSVPPAQPRPDGNAAATVHAPQGAALSEGPCTLNEIAASGSWLGLERGVTFAEEVQGLMRAAKQCMEISRDSDGTPRDIKLFLAACTQWRHALETLARHGEAAFGIEKIQLLNRCIIEEVAKESPECEKRILNRLGVLLATPGERPLRVI